MNTFLAYLYLLIIYIPSCFCLHPKKGVIETSKVVHQHFGTLECHNQTQEFPMTTYLLEATNTDITMIRLQQIVKMGYQFICSVYVILLFCSNLCTWRSHQYKQKMFCAH